MCGAAGRTFGFIALAYHSTQPAATTWLILSTPVIPIKLLELRTPRKKLTEPELHRPTVPNLP